MKPAGMKRVMKKVAMKKGAMKKVAMKKAMKRVMKAKKVSHIAKGKHARAVVFSGKKAKTRTGLTKDRLMKNKSGKIVSKKASAHAKKLYAKSGAKKWVDACNAARKSLGLKGFVPIGGKSAAGKAFYAKAT